MASLNPMRDAELIYEALAAGHSSSTYETRLADVLCNRSNYYLTNEVAPAFYERYNEDMVSRLKSDLKSSHTTKLFTALATPRPDFVAVEVRECIKGLGTDEKGLVDMICHTSSDLLQMAEMAYTRLFNKSMIEAIRSDTSGSFRQLLLALCEGNRQHSTEWDMTNAKRDAELLYGKGESKWGSDDKFFIDFFSRRSIADLAAVDHQYEQLYGKPLISAIEKETSGHYRQALMALAKPKDVYFAERVHDAVKGLGTRENVLIRIFALLDKPELMQVSSIYEQLYKQSMVDAIRHDTKGAFETALLTRITGSMPSSNTSSSLSGVSASQGLSSTGTGLSSTTGTGLSSTTGTGLSSTTTGNTTSAGAPVLASTYPENTLGNSSTSSTTAMGLNSTGTNSDIASTTTPSSVTGLGKTSLDTTATTSQSYPNPATGSNLQNTVMPTSV
ncbi:Annexin A11 [Sorochytrium milnesiophthora]